MQKHFLQIKILRNNLMKILKFIKLTILNNLIFEINKDD